MRLFILSDLHLDHDEPDNGFKPQDVDCDAVVMAGDISLGKSGLRWIQDHFPATPVVYVLGNHEFYKHAIPELTDELKHEAQGTKISILENDSVEIGGVTFLGCTLWTDFMLFGREEKSPSLRVADKEMHDFGRLITHRGFEGDDGYAYKFEAIDSMMMHEKSCLWLETELAKPRQNPVVVVTHHAPCTGSLHPERRSHRLGPCFASNLDQFVASCGADLWVHGHIHYHADYLQGNTRVLCNPRGYPHSQSGFDTALVVDV